MFVLLHEHYTDVKSYVKYNEHYYFVYKYATDIKLYFSLIIYWSVFFFWGMKNILFCYWICW